MTEMVAALDIGGTKLAAALVDRFGSVWARQQVPSPADAGPHAVIAAAVQLIDRVSAACPERPIGLGVATAGVVDVEQGVIRSAVATIRGWAGISLGPILSGSTGLPTVVHNDVNAIALAETRWGTARGARSSLVVALGTGVGGALVFDGELYRGRTDTAGEVGHLPVDVLEAGEPTAVCSCGCRGHLEALVAGPAIARRYAAAAGISAAPSLEAVGQACRRGEETAARVVAQTGEMVGRALGGLVNAVDPDLLVLAGGVLGLGPDFLGPLARALRATALPGPSTVPVRVSTFGADAGIVGAAVAAFDYLPNAARRSAPTPAAGA